MRIGYPCINLSLTCRPSRTFRLASFSAERLRKTIESNLNCLEEIVRWNAARGLLFLRITSDLVPFASHPANTYPWAEEFAPVFERIGNLIRTCGMRISMHPDQFVLLNALRPEVVASSIRELEYHAQVLTLLGLDEDAKIQIHLGGVYGDKKAAIERFVSQVQGLQPTVRKRLVVENDERLFTLEDCLQASAECGIPVLFDVFHHTLNGDGRDIRAALAAASATWGPADGLPLVDYSSPLPAGRTGSHAHTLDEADFQRFLAESYPYDFDLMLEVKDKERSALRATQLAASDPRFIGNSVNLLEGTRARFSR